MSQTLARVRQSMTLLCLLAMTCTVGAVQAPATPLFGQDPGASAQDPNQAPPPDQQQDAQAQGAPAQDQPQLTPQQLDDLVTPIALYADPLIAQILAASTYPLEVVQADRWLQSNSNLTGTALTEAAQQQNWDPSVQALVVFPSVLQMMDKNLTWTTDLGNAFLAQQQDVMDSVQRMRQKAYASGKLQSNAQQTVAQSVDNGQQVITIQPPSPNVVYVPVYNPVAIWGPPIWNPWGPFWYPPQPRYGFVAGWGGGFFIGIGIGGFYPHWGGWGGWGWGMGWGHRNVYINNNFYVVNHYRVPGGVYRGGSSAWVHNPAHRAGVPYPTRNVANRVGYRGPGGRPIGGPGGRPSYGAPGGGRPVGAPGSRPGEGRPPGNPGNGRPPGNPGNNRPPNGGGRPGGQPGYQPRPGGGGRPPDRSALNDVQTPGNRAQVERARGYSSMGNRGGQSGGGRPAPQSRPSGGGGRPSGGGKPH
jgi:Protein of unknown function (DUF3300)